MGNSPGGERGGGDRAGEGGREEEGSKGGCVCGERGGVKGAYIRAGWWRGRSLVR